MSKIIEVNKCPNCSGKLEKSEDGLKMVCMFCNSEFELAEDEEEEKEKTQAKITDWGKEEWFEPRVPLKKVKTGSDTGKLLKCFVKCANDLGTSEKILKYIKTDIKKGSSVGMPGNNEAKMNSFTARLKKGTLDADEKPLIYGNTALLSNGKKGILITDKRTVVVGSSEQSLLHEDLDSISFDTGDDVPFVYLNGNDKLKFTSIMSCDEDIMGAMLALICAFSFEKKAGRDKIVLCKYEDEDDEE